MLHDNETLGNGILGLNERFSELLNFLEKNRKKHKFGTIGLISYNTQLESTLYKRIVSAFISECRKRGFLIFRRFYRKHHYVTLSVGW